MSESRVSELLTWDRGLYHQHAQHEKLAQSLFEMAKSLRLDNILQISDAQLRAFFKSVEKLMKPQPYHNFTHISDVSQAVYSILVTSNLARWLTDAEVAIAFLAAVCHDLDHPGNSNVLEINENTPLAQEYPESPLENHHSGLACNKHGLLDKHAMLAKLDEGTQAEIREGIRQLILATDMAKHNAKTGEMQVLLSGGAKAVTSMKHDPAQKLVILENVLKFADISNQARHQEAADFWNTAVYHEFYSEGDRDKACGRKVNPIHDRHTNVVCKSSIGFCKFVVTPMVQLIYRFLALVSETDPHVTVGATARALELLQKNTDRYMQQAAQLLDSTESSDSTTVQPPEKDHTPAAAVPEKH